MIKLRTRLAFTIIEILIAIVVLVLGITGIIALFPTAIESGNQTVEDSYAAAVTQSVVDAVTVGIRESRYSFRTSPSNREWTYFIFSHDGVVDPLPDKPQSYSLAQTVPSNSFGYAAGQPTGTSTAMHDKDYCILLPQAVALPSDDSGVSTGEATLPNAQSNLEPVFLYPVPLRPSPSEADQRSLARVSLGTVIDNLALKRWRPAGDDTTQPWFPRVYSLGVYRYASGIPAPAGSIKLEFLGEDVGGVKTIARDPYPNYSFCFEMQRARIDSNGNGVIDNNDFYTSSLFQVRVRIFKNFDQGEANAVEYGAGGTPYLPKTNIPLQTFVTLVSL